ncbi:recombination mediator RecR [Mycoplasma feriruminatoris]|uniref:Recombination protein RecR n=1 Tax=Mycoplasma feriruminatoris TaxID=1179777 RepID=A0AAQ3HYC0_9MOLU|nr:recombination mediator RecR [Mycoplasma feriruminatoris]UKS53725.1 recombination protein RecR [Mycoplasma feriruminatoris]WFQ89822.1 Recombination protein RecR [Mycoplasma feriruminatoris]WFQ90642.1 recombination protein RecR [Mycoplasma feriruminatoris]WFQ91460.1 Recombination protein RecR [Mycoplasma feriruminatoris]WFQ92286.1 Recombination protein RecR [Mycoplasma feriruminatoris]
MSENIFDEIINSIRTNQGLTKKTSERLLVDLLLNKDKLNEFVNQLNKANQLISICKICGYLSENNKCLVCSLDNRNQNTICIVATILDAKNIESTNKYKGVYHILNGEINLNKNITFDKLNISSIFKRINDNTEIILALNSTFEGELTANYLYKLLSTKNIKITRLAKGIPMGASLDYMDEFTLQSAFINRKKYGE